MYSGDEAGEIYHPIFLLSGLWNLERNLSLNIIDAEMNAALLKQIELLRNIPSTGDVEEDRKNFLAIHSHWRLNVEREYTAKIH